MPLSLTAAVKATIGSSWVRAEAAKSTLKNSAHMLEAATSIFITALALGPSSKNRTC